MKNLKNEVVFITGASSGIGAACARAFSGLGTRLLLAARRIERLDAMVTELENAGAGEVRTLELDVRDAAAVGEAVQTLPDGWNRIYPPAKLARAASYLLQPTRLRHEPIHAKAV